MSLSFGLKHTVDFGCLQENELLDGDTNAENMVYSRVKLNDSDRVDERNKTRVPRRGPWWSKILALPPPPPSRKRMDKSQQGNEDSQQKDVIPSIGSISMQRAKCTRHVSGLPPMTDSRTEKSLMENADETLGHDGNRTGRGYRD